MGIRSALEARRSRQAELVLAILASRPAGCFGYDIWRLTGYGASVYPALARLEREGLAVSQWRHDGKRKRRMYWASPEGLTAAARG